MKTELVAVGFIGVFAVGVAMIWLLWRIAPIESPADFVQIVAVSLLCGVSVFGLAVAVMALMYGIR